MKIVNREVNPRLQKEVVFIQYGDSKLFKMNKILEIRRYSSNMEIVNDISYSKVREVTGYSSNMKIVNS